jgi:hypothetical protein
MSDSRRDRNPNKIRITASGGLEDLLNLRELIKSTYEDDGWEMNWYQLKPRGDFGPLHDLQLGFIESLT